jgi:hypothetical protein
MLKKYGKLKPDPTVELLLREGIKKPDLLLTVGSG